MDLSTDPLRKSRHDGIRRVSRSPHTRCVHVTQTLAELQAMCHQLSIDIPPQRRPAKEPYLHALRDPIWAKENPGARTTSMRSSVGSLGSACNGRGPTCLPNRCVVPSAHVPTAKFLRRTAL